MSVLSTPINQLLAALPAEDYRRLLPHLEAISLPLAEVLYEAGGPINHVYFPNQSVVSLVATLEDGSIIEVGLVGREGMVGIPVFMGGNTTTTRAIVQVADGAMKMKTEVLKAEFNWGVLQTLLLRYMQALFTQVSQSAVCNRRHTLEERLARWLLLVQDCVQSDQLLLTQEFMSQMLGIRRAGVTVAAGILSKAGMIHYSRGKITVLDRQGLEAASCGCYRIIADECSRLLGQKKG